MMLKSEDLAGQSTTSMLLLYINYFVMEMSRQSFFFPGISRSSQINGQLLGYKKYCKTLQYCWDLILPPIRANLISPLKEIKPKIITEPPQWQDEKKILVPCVHCANSTEAHQELQKCVALSLVGLQICWLCTCDCAP